MTRDRTALFLKAGTSYFAIVFAAGFVLGTVRVLWLVPRVGARFAELMETPLMLAVSFVAARSLIRRLQVPCGAGARIGMGSVALGLLLAAEFGVMLPLRGLSLAEYFATRDPISGTVYYLSLLVFATIPLLVARR